MQLGMIGLGRMGFNMARRLVDGGHRVVGYDRAPAQVDALRAANGAGATSVEDMIAQLDAPRAVWVMIPAGSPTTQQVEALAGMLSPADIVIDGGNSNYHDSLRHAEMLKQRGIHFLDVGVSGGVWGYTEGFCMMAGGDPQVFATVEPILKTLAPENGYRHVGPNGAGHFAKMVHNGIEYGMMQAFAEGFSVLKAREEFSLDIAAIAELWRHSSVVRSWLLDLCGDFLKHDQQLDDIAPIVADSGEGRWTALEAIEQGIPAPVMSLALMMRFASQGKSDFGDKMLVKMRAGFGGHAITHQAKK